jgi:hypothetical protein
MCNCVSNPCQYFCICCGRQVPYVVRQPWQWRPQPVRYIPVIPDLPTPIQTIAPWLGELRLTQ